MIFERPDSRIRKRGLTAVLLALVLLITAFSAVSGMAVELDNCSITVNAPAAEEGDASYDELDDADIVMDFYQVAPARTFEEMDSYVFGNEEGKWNKGFESQKAVWERLVSKAESEKRRLSAEELNGFTQSLTKLVFSDGSETGKYDFQGADIRFGDKANVEAGLYLIIIHSKGAEDYVRIDGEDYSTVADGPTKTYHFAPLLVSVPVREGADKVGSVTIISNETDIESPAELSDGSGEGSWINDVEITAKVALAEDDMPIDIVKSIDIYDNVSHPLTFVFEVKAEREVNGRMVTVYNDLQTVTFTKAGKKTHRVVDNATGEEIRVPTDCIVTIKEKKYGSSYKPDQLEWVQADNDGERYIAYFENSYEETEKHGGAVLNNVHPVSDEAGHKWEITPVLEDEK